MKKIFGPLVIGTLIFLLVVALHTPPEKNGENFLNAFYTSTTQEEPWIGDAKATVALKKERFDTFFSKDAFMVFLVETDWDLLQLQVGLGNNTCRPEDIVLQPQGNGDYSFDLTVVLCDKQTNEVVKEVAQSGYMSFNNRGKLIDFSIEMFDVDEFYIRKS